MKIYSKKQYILIVEPCSSGLNYIKDTIEKGYTPLVLEVIINDPLYIKKFRSNNRKFYNDCAVVIQEQKTYKDTLKLIKKYNVIACVASAEFAVPLFARLSNDLNLPSIPYDKINQYIDKYYMHKALENAGLPHIRGEIVNNVEKGLEYYKNLNCKEVIIKPPFGSGSFGIHICKNTGEVKSALISLLSSKTLYNEKIHNVLIQEKIEGDEYYINTISRNGKHRIISWAKLSYFCNDDSVLINHATYLDINNKSIKFLSSYLFDVLDALNIKDGPVHTELFMTDKGPILIEVNCRICGADIKSEFLDKVYGMHDSEEILDALISAKKFDDKFYVRPQYLNRGSVFLAYAPVEMTAVDLPAIPIVENLSSSLYHSLEQIEGCIEFNISKGMLDSIGTVYIVGKNDHDSDLNLLYKLFNDYFDLAFQYKEEQKISSLPKNNQLITSIISKFSESNCNLVITDELNNYQQGTNCEFVDFTFVDKIKWNSFDNILIDLDITTLNNRMKRSQIFTRLFNIFKMVSSDGTIYIPDSTYNCMPYSKKGMMFLLEVLQYSVECLDGVIVSKR